MVNIIPFRKVLFLALLFMALGHESFIVAARTKDTPRLMKRAVETFEAVRQHMSTDDKTLLQEAIPVRQGQNPYSYLWGYSAMVSSVSAMYEASGDKRWLKVMDGMMLEGLDKYYDDKRAPAGYASYISTAPQSDRFYDDNIWLGIDMADLYVATGKKKYLARAEEIWTFVMSGYDDRLGGGVYWCEQNKNSKNTCSNAPASVFALKMYKATKDGKYLERGTALYKWTRDSLEDKTDHLYFDHLTLNGKLGKTKYSYNTGQMIQAAAMLYGITGEAGYLTDARLMAESAYRYFFDAKESLAGLRLLKGGEMWFDSVMLRGYLELYAVDRNRTYIDAFIATMDEAWSADGSRDDNGLFGARYDTRGKRGARTLLNQAAMIEMMARLSVVDK